MQGIKHAFWSLLFQKGPKDLKKVKTLSWKQKVLVEGVFKSWWVFLFLLICALVYEPHFLELKKNEEQLQKKLLDLNEEKIIALKIQEDLQLQIDSQEDHDWIELTLMRKLGLVPEGHNKYLFIKKSGEIKGT